MNKKTIANITYYSAPMLYVVFLCSIIFFILVCAGKSYQYAFTTSIISLIVCLITTAIISAGIYWYQWAKDNKD